MRCPEEHPVFQANIRWGEQGGIRTPRVPITHICVSQRLLEESAQAEENIILRARCGKPRHNTISCALSRAVSWLGIHNLSRNLHWTEIERVYCSYGHRGWGSQRRPLTSSAILCITLQQMLIPQVQLRNQPCQVSVCCGGASGSVPARKLQSNALRLCLRPPSCRYGSSPACRVAIFRC